MLLIVCYDYWMAAFKKVSMLYIHSIDSSFSFAYNNPAMLYWLIDCPGSSRTWFLSCSLRSFPVTFSSDSVILALILSLKLTKRAVIPEAAL
jgi:hypothetical protein